MPDPEADIAECLLDAGRLEEADALFATLRERDPADVWLYNSAAYSYAGIDVAASLRWALAGIEVALATGDPDEVVMQLLEFAEDTSRAELDERARRDRRRLVEAELPEAAARLDAGFGPEPTARRAGPVTLAIGWFPADQWPEAFQRWPDLLDDLPSDHLDYSHETEARIKRISRHAPEHRLHVTAMTVDGVEAYAEESGNDPGSGEARSAYAATLLAAGDAGVWPPGRNEPCWCGSERKYKKCCGPVPAAEDGHSEHLPEVAWRDAVPGLGASRGRCRAGAAYPRQPPPAHDPGGAAVRR